MDEHKKVEETLIYFGDTVKALGDGKIGGYLVRYGSPEQLDLEGDFFSRDTELGIDEGSSIPVFYQHGYDGHFGKSKLGTAKGKFDDVGLWVEAQLALRDEYEQALYKLAEAGKMGWSSGAAGHLVEYEQIGKAWHIKSWPIAEASLTPTPAEPQNSAMPIKSLFEPVEPDKADVSDDGEEVIENSIKETAKADTEKNIMNQDEIRAMLEEVATKAATDAAEKTVEATAEKWRAEYAETREQIKGYFDVEIVEDEADKALKGNPFEAGEFFRAVKQAAVAPYDIDKRLLPLKATGLNEAIPSQGGFLIPTELAAGIATNMWGTGTLLSFLRSTRVSGNNMVFNAIDETARADGSRWGGIRGYWLEEGLDKTASKPQFSQINLKLKKVAALCYATDELLEDTTALESWLSTYVPLELRFKVGDSVINGTGVGMPLGILNSPALVSVVRTNANNIDIADIARMWAARYPGVNDYIWLANADIMPEMLQLSVSNMPVWMPPGGVSEAPYARLLGRPYVEVEYMPALGTAGDLTLFSPSQYAMIDKGGVQTASSIHVQFVTDETAFRFVYRVDGEPFWKSSIAKYKASTDSVSPYVVLAATT